MLNSCRSPLRAPLRAAVALALALALGVVGGVTAVVAPSATRPAAAEFRNPIMGAPRISAEGMVAWYKSKRGIPAYRATVPIETLTALFINEGVTENVRGDVAFIQSIKETGWFNFPDYGQVRPWDNNFAGIGACNSCSGGRTFVDAQLGVRAQIQHLRNYADPTSRASNLKNPPWTSAYAYDRFFYKGAAPNWEDLNGKWAYPGVGYGESIIDMYADMLQWAGASWTCPPDAGAQSSQTRGTGYTLASADGGVFTFGAARFYGSLGALILNRPIIGLTLTPDGGGYVMYSGDGGVFTFGNAPFLGSLGNIRLNNPIVGFTFSSSGRGYWMVSSDGGVFAFGDAPFLGSLGRIRLNNPIIGMARSPSGNGYWLFSSDGGVFAFGDAPYLGSMGNVRLNRPITAAAAARTRSPGYFLLSEDGGVFTFGTARFAGSLAGCAGRRSIAIVPTRTNGGYWIQTAEGRVVVFGDAKHFGWPFRINQPPIAFAARG
ncbi:MAG: hypothetical protein ACOYNI_01775 [Acidimicrobiia bacterium]